MKLAIVINGKGGSGKDSICDVVASHHSVVNVSSITPIKWVAENFFGWKKGKTDKDRKFLSDLKKLSTDYNDLPNRYCVNEFHKFLSNEDAEVFFVHIREPENIEKFIESVDGQCITLLVRGGKSKSEQYGNHSDDDVENYNYDFVFENNGSYENLDEDFMKFFSQMANEVEGYYLPH